MPPTPDSIQFTKYDAANDSFLPVNMAVVASSLLSFDSDGNLVTLAQSAYLAADGDGSNLTGILHSSDISDMATQTWVGLQGFVTGTPWTGEGYLTSISGQDLSTADNMTSAFITAAAIPSNISAFTNDAAYITSASIPTNVSSFTNDAGYLSDGSAFATAAQGSSADTAYGWGNHASAGYYVGDGSAFATAAQGALADTAVQGTPWTSAGYLTDISTLTSGAVSSLSGHNVSELTNDAGFITSASVPTNVSSFTNDAGYVTGTPWTSEGYLTNTYVGTVQSAKTGVDWATGLMAKDGSYDLFYNAGNGANMWEVMGDLYFFGTSKICSGPGSPSLDTNGRQLLYGSTVAADWSTGTLKDGSGNAFVAGTPWTSEGYVTGTPWTSEGYLTTETDPVYSANTYATGMNQAVATTSGVAFVGLNLWNGSTAGGMAIGVFSPYDVQYCKQLFAGIFAASRGIDIYSGQILGVDGTTVVAAWADGTLKDGSGNAFVTGTPWTAEGYVTGTPWTSAGYITTETDPVVGAITGIVKANGSGTISAATAGTDYAHAPASSSVADGTYTVGIGTATNGTVTTSNGIITAIVEATDSGGSAPATPTTLATNPISSTEVDLTWDAMSGATGYKVYRDASLVGSPSTNSFNDTGLAASTTYTYTVKSHNSYGDSTACSGVTGTTSGGGGGGGGANAMEFDGASNYITIPHSADFYPSGDFTIEFWAKTSSGGYFGLNLGGGGGSSGYILLLGTPYPFYIGINSGGFMGSPTGTVNDGSWHHFAAQREGSDITLWFDGVVCGSGTLSGAINDPGNDFQIGAYNSNYFAGMIDEFCFSNVARYPGTTTFVPATSFTPDGNTVMYLKFDEGTGTTVADSSGNGHNATATGTPAWVTGV